MRICKYCKKPISDNNVWNPDREGNGYHHACLCEIEFMLRDKQIYDKGRADILDKIRAEIEAARFIDKDTKLCKNANASGLEVALQIIDKYRESEVPDAETTNR